MPSMADRVRDVSERLARRRADRAPAQAEKAQRRAKARAQRLAHERGKAWETGTPNRH